jgi:DNA-binding winged helix-turn-helix (wHTH) protein/Tfp pilus assembly protein PilF
MNPANRQIGEWTAEPSTGLLRHRDGREERLEPRLADLLLLLADRPGEVIAREDILAAIWTGLVVDEDTLARAVSRLRRALGDDAKAPAYIETIPKRGYRLIAAVRIVEATTAPARRRRFGIGAALAAGVAACALAALFAGHAGNDIDAEAKATVQRADDFYARYTRPDNEAAIELYERIIGRDPDYAPAYAGLANALVQRAIRWPGPPGTAEFTCLRDALAADAIRSPAAQAQLERAAVLAARAVALAPGDAASHKAQGFVASARRDWPGALAAYHAALALDPQAWGVLINVSDVLEISARSDEALPWLERAHAAMTRAYASQPVRVQPWYAPLGVLIGDRHRARGDWLAAEAWYRRVLDYAPLQPEASAGLAAVLRASGRADAAARLCEDVTRRVGPRAACTQG